MAASSLSNRSLATPSLPLHSNSVPSKPASLQIPQPSISISKNSTPSNALVVASDDSLTISAMVEAVILANAAAESAKDAISSALVLERLRVGQSARRRRRRMRRIRRSSVISDNDGCEDIDDPGRFLIRGCSSRSERSGYLTRRQEAQFSLYLKIGAMLADTELGCATTDRNGRRGKTDRACLKARECRERITLSYKRLVVSIATPYQGKGLSLQDLIQVDPIFL